MKKIPRFFIVNIIILLIVCGCSNNNNTNTKPSNEKEIKNKFSEKYTFVNNIKCEALNEDIIDMDSSHLITKNKIYDYNKENLYSNEQNCKEVKIIDLDSEIITLELTGIETKNNVYKYSSPDKAYTSYYYLDFYSGIMEKRSNGYSKYKEYFSSLGSNIIYSSDGNISGVDGILSVDNKIKLYKAKSEYDANYSGQKTTYNYIDVDNIFSKNEYVISIINGIIKTDKAYYEVKRYKTNKEECEKYVDVKCKYNYKLVKNKFLSDNYKYIKVTDGFNLIDTNNNFYVPIY